MSEQKAVIKAFDMEESLRQSAIETAMSALVSHTVEKDVASYIKVEFDRRFGTTWHCVVGKNFGSYVTHESEHFIYFYIGTTAILLFKT